MGDLVFLHGKQFELPPIVVTVPLCDEPTVSTVCECAGLLAFIRGRYEHVEACIECLGSTLPCPDPGRHVACPDPAPRTCVHDQCREPVEVEIECGNGEPPRTCCGCCWVTADQLEGRRMWPGPMTRA